MLNSVALMIQKFAKETPAKPTDGENCRIPASCAFVPSVAGLIIAGEVIRDLTI